VVALVFLALGVFFYLRRTPKLTDKDTIVLADFDNKTGDPIFDDTLKTALNVSLRQSPFLSVLSDQQVAETLKLFVPEVQIDDPSCRHETKSRSDPRALPAGGKQGLHSGNDW
jgi:hypothetical protein